MNREHSGHVHFLTKLYVKCPVPAYKVPFFASEGAPECMSPPPHIVNASYVTG